MIYIYVVNKSSLRNIFLTALKYREYKSVDLDNAKSCTLSGFKDCADNFHNKHGIHRCRFTMWVNKVKKKVLGLLCGLIRLRKKFTLGLVF